MNSKDCLDSKQLIDYIDGKLTENDSQNITNHLAKCERCARNLKILTQVDEILNMKDKKVEDDIYGFQKSSKCISDELLYRYLDGNVIESEAEVIEKHLNACPICFSNIVSIVKNLFLPITDFEKSEITKLRTITPDEQVSKILQYCGQPGEKSVKGKKVKITATIKKRVKEFFEKWIYTKYIWRPAVIFSVLVFFIVGIYSGEKYYYTGYQISQAEKLLLNNHRIYIEDPRLSGGYGSTGISVLMGSEEKEPSYVEQTKLKLNKAIKKGSKSLKARHLLAQSFIIEKQNAKADSIFMAIGDTINTSAALLNDIGVLYFQKRDWKMAERQFQSALEIDKNFLEAYYNLALTEIKLHEPNEAMSFLKKYVEHEHNEAWKNAAQSLMNKIN